MNEESKSEKSLFGKIRNLSWWVFYSLFLLAVLFLLSLMIRSVIGGTLGRISNFSQLIYLVGLGMAVLSLMALCIAYVVKVMWYRLRANRGGQIQKG